jgi:hypothetical protein
MTLADLEQRKYKSTESIFIFKDPTNWPVGTISLTLNQSVRQRGEDGLMCEKPVIEKEKLQMKLPFSDLDRVRRRVVSQGFCLDDIITGDYFEIYIRFRSSDTLEDFETPLLGVEL